MVKLTVSEYRRQVMHAIPRSIWGAVPSDLVLQAWIVGGFRVSSAARLLVAKHAA